MIKTNIFSKIIIILEFILLLHSIAANKFRRKVIDVDENYTNTSLVNLPAWIANFPVYFRNKTYIVEHHGLGNMIDYRSNQKELTDFETLVDKTLPSIDGFTDGEIVDTVEHFFWGFKEGLALELGALDGSKHTRSMTYELERFLNWKRILIDGNPKYRIPMRENSPDSFDVIAAICSSHSSVHFRPAEYVGGILEFMSPDFLSSYHKDIYNAGVPKGNLTSINWDSFKDQVTLVDCMPLSHVLHKAHVQHVNFFILDVEGGELQVLSTVNWNITKFDVLCIEVDEINRPLGYSNQIINFMNERGYYNNTPQIGRNLWFVREGFIPSSRPNIDKNCYNGARMSFVRDQSYIQKKNIPFVNCIVE